MTNLASEVFRGVVILRVRYYARLSFVEVLEAFILRYEGYLIVTACDDHRVILVRGSLPST